MDTDPQRTLPFPKLFTTVVIPPTSSLVVRTEPVHPPEHGPASNLPVSVSIIDINKPVFSNTSLIPIIVTVTFNSILKTIIKCQTLGYSCSCVLQCTRKPGSWKSIWF